MSQAPLQSEEAEVLVVGAGPSGACAAAKLAQAGKDVVLLDQHSFPRDKPCGDGLWSGAVELLRDLGLDDLVSRANPIEGTRVMRVGAVRPVERSISSSGRRAAPVSLPRVQLDEAVVDVAINSGARFIQARAVDVVREATGVSSVLIRLPDGRKSAITARAIIAADGASSRMRRVLGVSARVPWRAFAIRRYFRTENEVDPVFEIHIPFRLGGRRLPGYGWIFPTSAFTANIGVGFYGHGSGSRWAEASLSDALSRFTAEVGRGRGSRLGGIEAISAAAGAPLALNYSPSAVQQANVFFAGDAANLVDPLIGEGIASALESGRMVAECVVDWLQRRRARCYSASLELRFPRLGQDVNIVVRRCNEVLAGSVPSTHSLNPRVEAHQFLEDVAAVLMRGSEAADGCWTVPNDFDSISVNRLASELTALHNSMLSALRTRFPFALDLLSRHFHAGMGPTAAAVLIGGALAFTDEVGSRIRDAALALELLRLATILLGQASDARSESAVVGNGLATLIGDHALSKGLEVATRLGTAHTVEFARLAKSSFEAAMADIDAEWDLSCGVAGYISRAQAREGRIHEHACLLAVALTGADVAADAFSAFGAHLGIAVRTSSDIVDLTEGDNSVARLPGDALRRGRFALPVYFAVAENSSLSDLLTAEALQQDSDAITSAASESTAIEKSVEICRQHAEAAADALRALEVAETEALFALPAAALDRVAKARELG